MHQITAKITDNTLGPFKASDCIKASGATAIPGVTLAGFNTKAFVHGGYGSIRHDPATAGVNVYVGDSTLNLAASPINGRLLRKGEEDAHWAVMGNTVHMTEYYFNGDNNSIVTIMLEVQ